METKPAARWSDLGWRYVLAISVAVTMGWYEFLVRRSNVRRFLFDMKLLPREVVMEPAEQPVASSQV